MINYTVKISDLALATLDKHILFLRNFNITFSLKIREKIIHSIDNLTIFPNSNPIYKRNYYTYRKRIINNTYSIIYIIDKNIIYVLYILDGRQAYDTYFKSLV